LINDRHDFREAVVQKYDPGSWEALSRLLDQALELPPPALADWLDSLPAEHDALKPQLRRMLAVYARVETSDFLNTLPKFEVQPEDLHAPRPVTGQAGEAIGPYRLLRELGSGGMGVVWLAERTDGLIVRPVALKLPHGAWKHAGLAERMARERTILASLTHPHIAHLYDAGVTTAGQPYLAIEYVEGTRIDQYCRERRLEARARLQLFAQVANAVAYAHGKLVVHRDLKPANILVTAEGQARLLDFGIAKLLEDGEARETQFTEISGRALTPDYASPEQILGEPLTTASDVYSLGVILYELLCDQRPYKLQRDSRGALEEAILQAEPPSPSERVDARQRRALRGDLDTVVLKALKKKPAERYATVHALLDDIERHLASRPVLAQRDSRWYRIRKFVARNKLGVAAALTIFVVAMVGTGVSAWQARAALAQKARAEQVQDFIASVFREADPTQGEGKVLSAAALLLQAEQRLQEQPYATPELRLELLVIIGESLFGLQENKESARVLKQALQLEAAMPTREPALAARLHLGLSQADELLGNNDEAQAELERAFAALASAGNLPTALLVQARLHQSALGIVSGNYEVAEKSAQQAIELSRKTSGTRSMQVATGLQQLSHVYLLTQRRAEAVAPAREAHEIMLELHARNLNNPKVIETTEYYAQALNTVGDFEAAAALFADARTRAAAVFGKHSRLYGETLSAFVPLEIEIGELPAAISDAREALDIYLLEGTPGSPTHAGRVRKLGNALLAARAGKQALEQTALAMKLCLEAKSALETLHARSSYGLALAYQGRFGEADPLLRESIRESAGKAARAHHLALRNLGTSLRLQGRQADALSSLDQATQEASLQYSHRADLAHGLLETGLAALALSDLARAQESFTKAEALFADVQKTRLTPARAELFVGVARVKMQRAKYADALESLQRADAYWQQAGADNRWAGETALWLGRCHQELGHATEAIAALRRAEPLLAASPLPGDAALARLAHQGMTRARP